jgi:hypothetical protein
MEIHYGTDLSKAGGNSMNDDLLKTNEPMRRKRSSSKTIKMPADDITVINVPKPPASAFNKNRLAGCLIHAQVRHIHHAESARLPKEKRDGRRPEDILTEAEAASYIAAVTKVLHTQRRRMPRSRPATS